MTPYRRSPALSIALPERFFDELRAEVEGGESVLWAAVPDPKRLARRALASFGFPILWNGFVIVLVYGAAAAKDGGLLWLFAVPLLAVGLPLFQRPVEAWQEIHSTFYALTDKRALVFEGDEVYSYPRERLVAFVATRRSDGSGDVVFVLDPCWERRPGFFGIDRVGDVESLLEAA